MSRIHSPPFASLDARTRQIAFAKKAKKRKARQHNDATHTGRPMQPKTT